MTKSRRNTTAASGEQTISFRINRETAERLREVAEQEDRTVSYITRRALVNYLDERDAA